MDADLDVIQARAKAAADAVGEEWSWDDGTLIDLCRHESPIGIECTWASGSPAAPHIAQMDPKTTLALVAELRAHRQAWAVAGPIVEGLRPMHGRTAKAHSSPCAACRFVAAVDKLTEETTEPARGDA